MKEITLRELKEIRKNRGDLKAKVYIKKIDKKYYILDKEDVKEENLIGRAMICFDCANGYCSKCPKIGYKGYRKLENFPYVRIGIEIIGRYSTENNVIVIECVNFAKEIRPDVSMRREKKKNLAMFYYDAADEDDLRRLKRQALEKFRRQCQGK